MLRDEHEAVTFEGVLEAYVRDGMAETYVSFPAIVEEYDSHRNVASVSPTVRYRFGNKPLRCPPLVHMPVCFWGGAGYSIHTPLKKGDTVLCIVADRSLDEWATVGGKDVTPRSWRMHNLNDAIVLCRISPDNAPSKLRQDDAMVIGDDQSGLPYEPWDWAQTPARKFLRIGPDSIGMKVERENEEPVGIKATAEGKLAVGELAGEDPAELVTLLWELLEVLEAGLTSEPGVKTLNVAGTAAIAALKLRLSRIRP